jgi:hypothetical protein
VHEYTGVIGVSGRRKSAACVTAARPFVIPINWRSHSAKVIVCLE